MSDLIRKTLYVDVESKDLAEDEIIVAASTPDVDREGDIVDIQSMDLSKFRKNPVIGYFHQYNQPAVGKALWIKKSSSGKLLAKIKFANTERGRELAYLYKEGFMNAVSIGFIPQKIEWKDEGDKKIRIFKNAELLEISVVLVPANASALVEARGKGLLENLKILEDLDMVKTVIPYKETPLADPDTKWDGAREVREASVEDLKVMCTWYAEKGERKGDYKLPHHLHNKPHKCVWNGVRAAMGALLGARGGVDIPDKDRKGVYNHLAKHYEDFGKEPPELREYTEEELKEMFPEIYEMKEYEWKYYIGEISYTEYKRMKSEDEFNELKEEVKEMREEFEEIKKLFAEVKQLVADLKEEIKNFTESISKFLVSLDNESNPGGIRDQKDPGDTRDEGIDREKIREILSKYL